MNSGIVKLENVTKKFGNKTIIKDINLEIYEGEFLTLLGPSGCGKTTMLRLISGLETVTSGKIYIDDKDVTNVDPTKREVNTIFQNFALFPHMNVYDNVAFGLRMKHESDSVIGKKVKKAIKLVNLEGFESRFPRELSGGQQQRVAIARGIVMNPRVLLLDESLCSLDLKLKRKMQVELKKLQRKLNITFVYVTHDQNEALTMSDRIAIINKGVIEQLDTPKNLYKHPNTLFAADFIGESNILDAEVLGVIDGSYGKQMLIKLKEADIDVVVSIYEKYKKKEELKVVIRPEYIKISKNHIIGGHEGIVDDLIFNGDYSKLYVKVNNYIFKVDVNDIDAFKKDDIVYVKFDRDRINVLRD